MVFRRALASTLVCIAFCTAPLARGFANESISSLDTKAAVELLKASFKCPKPNLTVEYTLYNYVGNDNTFRVLATRYLQAKADQYDTRTMHRYTEVYTAKFRNLAEPIGRDVGPYFSFGSGSGYYQFFLRCRSQADCIQLASGDDNSYRSQQGLTLCDRETAENVKAAVETLIRFNTGSGR